MKTLAALGLVTLGFSAQASTQIFNASSGVWTEKYTIFELPPTFSDLEQLGVERWAEKQAFGECVTSGATDCVILESRIKACNYQVPTGSIDEMAIGCEAVATARGQMQ